MKTQLNFLDYYTQLRAYYSAHRAQSELSEVDWPTFVDWLGSLGCRVDLGGMHQLGSWTRLVFVTAEEATMFALKWS